MSTYARPPRTHRATRTHGGRWRATAGRGMTDHTLERTLRGPWIRRCGGEEQEGVSPLSQRANVGSAEPRLRPAERRGVPAQATGLRGDQPSRAGRVRALRDPVGCGHHPGPSVARFLRRYLPTGRMGGQPGSTDRTRVRGARGQGDGIPGLLDEGCPAVIVDYQGEDPITRKYHGGTALFANQETLDAWLEDRPYLTVSVRGDGQ